MTLCLHILTTSSRCDRCGVEVAEAAQQAARLRGAASPSAQLVNIANHGVTTLKLVRGDEVLEVDVLVRPRSEDERESATQSAFVAEVVRGCRFVDGFEVAAGQLHPVAVSAYMKELDPEDDKLLKANLWDLYTDEASKP